ncbi:hypothetical protein BJ912DRAFT_930300 [Pholiota molesta]|nr:hypothetical protein BJ912DRAFT_930300 [Pholiota molesta]
MLESNGSNSATTVNGGGTASGQTRALRPLTSRQERKLVDYLDENFLQLTRNFKKRFSYQQSSRRFVSTEESSKLKTLPAYLEESRHLLAFILQIPPVDPSTSLRISYMLRLTGDTLSSIQGYRLGTTDTDVRAILQDLVDFLDDLDQAWLAVLKGQVWDPTSKEGVDVDPPAEDTMEVDSNNDQDTINSTPTHSSPYKSSPPSQTDLTRLRSLLLAGEATLEEWLTTSAVWAETPPREWRPLYHAGPHGSPPGFRCAVRAHPRSSRGFGGDVARNVVDPEPEAQME